MKANLEVEEFRHQQLRKSTHGKRPKALGDRWVLTKARVITNKDVVRLREEQVIQNRKRAKKVVTPKRVKFQARKVPSNDDSDTAGHCNDRGTSESELAESDSESEKELEDVIIVTG